MHSRARKLIIGAATGVAALAMFSAPAAAGAENMTAATAKSGVGIAAINFKTPFDCGQQWTAKTYSGHNPQLSVDFQRSGASGKNVLSSAAGKIVTVKDLGNRSYGRYIVVDHGSGWQTLYAHLSSFEGSKVGQQVAAGKKIGKVGSTGGSTGPHLHYEQKLNGSVKKAVLNGLHVTYFGATAIKSSTNC